MNSLPRIGCCWSFVLFFQNYLNFEGRSRRSEYWYMIIFINVLLIFSIPFIYYYEWDESEYESYTDEGYRYVYYKDERTSTFYFLIVLFSLVFILIIIPELSATVRRLHDIGKSGNYIFLLLIPLSGHISLLVLLCTDSEAKANKYGPSTKYINNINNGNIIIPLNNNNINTNVPSTNRISLPPIINRVEVQ